VFDSQKNLKRFCLLFGGAVACLVIYTIIRRCTYPYELEWYEGTFLVHALQFVEGKHLYSPPSAHFIPWLYTPLFPMISSVLLQILGISIPVMRIVPILASLGTAVVLFFIVKNMTEDNFAAVISSFLFISTYKACDFYFDIARVDPLNLFWLAMGLFFIKTKPNYKGMIFGGFCLALSYASKQSATIFIGALCLSLLFEDVKKMLVFLLSSVGTVFLLMTYLTYSTNGWAQYYILRVVSDGYAINPSFILKNWVPDLGVLMPGLSFFLLCFLSLVFTSRNWKKKLFAPETAIIIACLTASFLMRNKWGGVRNVLMPLSFAGCLAGGIVLGRCGKGWFKNLLYCFVVLQFFMGVFNPKYQIPTADDVRAGNEFIAHLQSVKGEVLMPYQTFYPYMAGKNYNMHAEPLRDITRIDKKVFPKDLSDNISKKKYSEIIVPYLGEGYVSEPELFNMIRKYYHKNRSVFKDDTNFYTKTGLFVRPEFIFIPK